MKIKRYIKQRAKEVTDPLVLRLAELARRKHYYCEDSWYSCPKNPDGCANDDMGLDCNCGADRINAEVDAILSELTQNDETGDRPDNGTPQP